jgi:phage tail-like protein
LGVITPFGLNSAVMALGKRLDPYLGVNFLVEIDGLIVGGFTKVDGLESAIETQDYNEGGRNDYVHKILKGTTYGPLVLSRGLTTIDSLWAWHERVRRGVVTRRNGTIMLLDAQRLPVMWWNFADALPIKWVGPSFDASAESQVAIERVELAHRGITKPLAGQLVAAARNAGAAGGRP